MIFRQCPIPGVFIIDLEKKEDERGFFARSWCAREFESHGLNPRFVQCNISFNRERGTLRGMHYQIGPFEEAKLVRYTSGVIHDVIVDLRSKSKTRGNHFSVVLSAGNRNMLYIPEGVAHGFLALEDDTEVFYQMSEFYAPDYARGFRWNDAAFEVELPIPVEMISESDRNWPDFE